MQWRHDRGENVRYKRPPDIGILEWIETHFVLDEKTGCKIWTLACDTYGYARLQDPEFGVVRPVAHIVWEAANGAIPDGCGVLHRCDNPPCINLEHLWVGTHLENMADRTAKGRGNNWKRRSTNAEARSRT